MNEGGTPMADVNPIPEGFRTVTPYLVVSDSNAAIDFYKKAFGAEERFRMTTPDGSKVVHAEITIGDSVVMLSDEFAEMGSKSPVSYGGTPVSVHLAVEDVDAWFARATEAGATVTMPLEDMFWGDRYGRIADPFGHSWSIATHIKDATEEEMDAALKQFFGG